MSFVQEVSDVRVATSRPSDRSLEREALLAARGDANILITGERGPGKAALARFIHEQSDRSSDGFSIVKCGRLSDEMVRFQLFGHVDDGTDGGSLDTPGLLTSPFCGTVFLEDVGSLGAATQDRLLRYLEANDNDQPIRFIASTTVNLKAQVAAGLFLSELYERLNARTLGVQSPSFRLRPSASASQASAGKPGYGGQARVDHRASIVPPSPSRLRRASQRSWAWLRS